MSDESAKTFLGFIHTWDLLGVNYCMVFSVNTIAKNLYTIHYWTVQSMQQFIK